MLVSGREHIFGGLGLWICKYASFLRGRKCVRIYLSLTWADFLMRMHLQEGEIWVLQYIFNSWSIFRRLSFFPDVCPLANREGVHGRRGLRDQQYLHMKKDNAWNIWVINFSMFSFKKIPCGHFPTQKNPLSSWCWFHQLVFFKPRRHRRGSSSFDHPSTWDEALQPDKLPVVPVSPCRPTLQ